MTMSSSALARSVSNLYWKPEQPPPSTLTRSMVPAASRPKISPILRAARSVTVTLTVMADLPPGIASDCHSYYTIVKCAQGRGQLQAAGQNDGDGWHSPRALRVRSRHEPRPAAPGSPEQEPQPVPPR